MLLVQSLTHLIVVTALINIFGILPFYNALFNVIKSEMHYLYLLKLLMNAFANRCMVGVQVSNAFLNALIFCIQMVLDKAVKTNAIVSLTLYGIILF